MSDSDLMVIEELMTVKGFKFYSDDDRSLTLNCSTYFWKFDSSNFLEVVRCKDNVKMSPGGVSYQFMNDSYNDLLRRECIKIGYKKVNTYVFNGRLRVLYKKGRNQVLFSSKNIPKGFEINEVTVKIVN